MIDPYIVSTYRPRFCGIAEFSANIVGALKKYGRTSRDIGNPQVAAIDISNRGLRYDNQNEVFTLIEQNDLDSWLDAADSINKRISDGEKFGRKGIVFANMEYGIIGDYGKKQDNLTPFLKRLKEKGTKSVVQAHTLPNPKHPDFEYHLKTLQNVAANTDAIISISKIAGDMLSREPYSLTGTSIVHIDHGVRAHNFRSEDRINAKKKYGLEDMIVVATFGFNSPGKGRDFSAIAHSEFLKGLSESQRKRVIYLMAGGFHPDFIDQDGGRHYRKYQEDFGTILEESGLAFKEVSNLTQLKEGDLEKLDLILLNKLLPDREFREQFKASDVVINPTRDRWQVSSGILAEVLGYGRSSISTESLYARETMLPDAAVCEEIEKRKGLKGHEKEQTIWDKSQGITVPLIDVNESNHPIPDIESITRGENYLLFEPSKRRRDMESRARVKGRRMGWNFIAGDYHRLFQEIIEGEEKKDERLPFLRKSTN